MEALIDLHQRLSILPSRCAERKMLVERKAQLYGLSKATIYRALKEYSRPKLPHRRDSGIPKILSKEEMEYYCQIIAALKVRTSNKKNRRLSTKECLRLLEEHGVTIGDQFVKVTKSLLKVSTINRYLKEWGYNNRCLTREPVCIRFQAKQCNECWHFDLSPSDLKQVNHPLAIKEGRGSPTLMLYSIVDDRSGVAYQEYHCVYGEDVEAALRFLFNAMSPKKVDGFPFYGIPKMIYMDNGPINKSLLFQRVMAYLEIDVKAHMPRGTDGNRTTARSKGKVERPFRTVKEMYETLYHLYTPKDECEANQGLLSFLFRYNSMQHRTEQHSRMEDWIKNLPSTGIQEMCTWERFCKFAREPEERTVASDARISVDATSYEVSPELAGEKVTLWWGLFDQELYVEYKENKYGPYTPIGEPIPLHHYRKFKKTKNQERAENIAELAQQISISREALISNNINFKSEQEPEIPIQKFSIPDPFQELSFSNAIEAKKAIAKYLGFPLAKLCAEELAKIDIILSSTLNKCMVMEQIRTIIDINKGEHNAQ